MSRDCSSTRSFRARDAARAVPEPGASGQRTCRRAFLDLEVQRNDGDEEPVVAWRL